MNPVTQMCEQVTERIALGEPLGELAEHAATCERCQAVSTISAKLGATRHAVDPGLGFSARMTVGAQHRVAVRRRHRIAAGLAATLVTGAAAVLLVTRAPEEPVNRPVAAPVPHKSDPWDTSDKPADFGSDKDLAELVQLADVDRSTHLSARWGHIKKPLRPYQQLIEGVTP